MTSGVQTLAHKLRAYFEANPDEELSTADIATKFGVTYSQVRESMGWLKRTGGFEFVRVFRVRRTVQ